MRVLLERAIRRECGCGRERLGSKVGRDNAGRRRRRCWRKEAVKREFAFPQRRNVMQSEAIAEEHGRIKQFALWELGTAEHRGEDLVWHALRCVPFHQDREVLLAESKGICIYEQRPALFGEIARG